MNNWQEQFAESEPISARKAIPLPPNKHKKGGVVAAGARGIMLAWRFLHAFIGIPGSAVAFVRDTDMDNAYIEIFRLFTQTLGW